MKKMFLTIMLLYVFLTSPSFGMIRNIQDNYRFIYNIVDIDGNHVTGQTVTIQIQKASNGYWYDFSDDTFKASGWTSKTTNLTEDSTNGLYYYTFNPPATETATEEYIFLVDNGSETYGDHQCLTVSYQNIGTSTHAATDVAALILATPAYKLVTDTSGRVTVGSNADKADYSILANDKNVLVDLIWDELQSGHSTADSFGIYLDSKVSGSGGGGLTVEDIVDGVWDETASDHVTSGTMGKKINQMPTPYHVGP